MQEAVNKLFLSIDNKNEKNVYEVIFKEIVQCYVKNTQHFAIRFASALQGGGMLHAKCVYR